MKDELVNIEEAGFTPEDLENAGVELETTEETDTQETATDEPLQMMRRKVMRMMRK